MNASLLDDYKLSAEFGASDQESVASDQNVCSYSSVSSGDSWSDSVSDNDGTGRLDYSEELLALYDDLGGIPVVVYDAAVAVGSDNGYQLSSYYVDYFSGVLANLGDTDYLAFCTREDYYQSGYNTYYTEHYRLVYDLELVDDQAVQGTYPCVDIYRRSGESVYTVASTTYSLTSIPSFSYGSFGIYSDLREGVTHETNYTLLFFLGFFAVYFVCRDIFKFIMERIYRK